VRRFRRGLVGAVVTVVCLVPTGVALAAQVQPSASVARVGAPCTGDRLQVHDRDVLYLHDGSRYVTLGYPHGAMDGSGPIAAHAMDGTGNQWGRVL
jgi:hypothetical protein